MSRRIADVAAKVARSFYSLPRMTDNVLSASYSSKYGLGACADGQLQKDMFYVRFHCLGRDLKGSSDAFIGKTLADHCEDVAFPRSKRIADAVPTAAQVADGFVAI